MFYLFLEYGNSKNIAYSYMCGAQNINGSLVQRLEPSAHNGVVAGSSPARPTIINYYKIL